MTSGYERRQNRTTVSYRCIDAAAHADLTGSRKSLLLAIAYRANRHNFQTFAGLDDLALIAGVSRATAKRALADLIADDWVVVLKEWSQHRPRLLMVNVLKCEANQVRRVKTGSGVTVTPLGEQDDPSGDHSDPSGFQIGQPEPSGVPDRLPSETVSQWVARIAEAKGMP